MNERRDGEIPIGFEHKEISISNQLISADGIAEYTVRRTIAGRDETPDSVLAEIENEINERVQIYLHTALLGFEDGLYNSLRFGLVYSTALICERYGMEHERDICLEILNDIKSERVTDQDTEVYLRADGTIETLQEDLSLIEHTHHYASLSPMIKINPSQLLTSAEMHDEIMRRNHNDS